MKYTAYLLPTAEKDCENLPKQVYLRCARVIEQLANNPRLRGHKKLVGADSYRVRVGDYRLIYRIDEATRRVYIYRVKHRREVYR